MSDRRPTGLPLDHQIDQRGPRAHHFAAGISIAVGVSFLVENTNGALTDAFRLLGPHGQEIWGSVFLGCGIVIFGSVVIVLRVVGLGIASLAWAVFAGLTGYGTWFGPFADQTTSYVTIMGFTMVLVCLLACSNLVRDYVPFRDRRIAQLFLRRRGSA